MTQTIYKMNELSFTPLRVQYLYPGLGIAIIDGERLDVRIMKDELETGTSKCRSMLEGMIF